MSSLSPHPVASQSSQWRREIAILSEVLAEHPKTAKWYLRSSECHLKLFEIDEAIADAQKAIELDNKFAQAYVQLAKCYRTFGKIGLGLQTIKPVLHDHAAQEMQNILRADLDAGGFPHELTVASISVAMEQWKPQYALSLLDAVCRAFQCTGFAVSNVFELCEAAFYSVVGSLCELLSSVALSALYEITHSYVESFFMNLEAADLEVKAHRIRMGVCLAAQRLVAIRIHPTDDQIPYLCGKIVDLAFRLPGDVFGSIAVLLAMSSAFPPLSRSDQTCQEAELRRQFALGCLESSCVDQDRKPEESKDFILSDIAVVKNLPGAMYLTSWVAWGADRAAAVQARETDEANKDMLARTLSGLLIRYLTIPEAEQTEDLPPFLCALHGAIRLAAECVRNDAVRNYNLYALIMQCVSETNMRATADCLAVVDSAFDFFSSSVRFLLEETKRDSVILKQFLYIGLDRWLRLAAMTPADWHASTESPHAIQKASLIQEKATKMLLSMAMIYSPIQDRVLGSGIVEKIVHRVVQDQSVKSLEHLSLIASSRPEWLRERIFASKTLLANLLRKFIDVGKKETTDRDYQREFVLFIGKILSLCFWKQCQLDSPHAWIVHIARALAKIDQRFDVHVDKPKLIFRCLIDNLILMESEDCAELLSLQETRQIFARIATKWMPDSRVSHLILMGVDFIKPSMLLKNRQLPRVFAVCSNACCQRGATKEMFFNEDKTKMKRDKLNSQNIEKYFGEIPLELLRNGTFTRKILSLLGQSPDSDFARSLNTSNQALAAIKLLSPIDEVDSDSDDDDEASAAVWCRCDACGVTVYCSQQCLEAHANRHATKCESLKQEYANSSHLVAPFWETAPLISAEEWAASVPREAPDSTQA